MRFEVAEPLLGALYCHCKSCQRRTGTAFSVSGPTAPGSFGFTAGEELVSAWDPADGDRDPGVRPAAHQFGTNVPDYPA